MGMKGDFLSFSFAGVDSSDLNIVRTSDGDRFDEELTPEIKDVTVEVPGMDGEYFFGSTYGTRTFEISFAYDSLTEEQFRKLRKAYGQRRLGELIFSERPYKRYIAKIESPIELSYICFDERKYIDDGSRGTGIKGRELRTMSNDTQRIYKGEGKITFIAYFPFAKSCFKTLPAEGSEDWAVSSGILSADARDANSIDVCRDGVINVYNPGDVATGFRLYIPMSAAGQQVTLSYTHSGAHAGEVIPQLVLNSISQKDEDVGILIDTNTGLIIGVSSMGIDQDGNALYTTSGNLYNEYVESGYFFKLQPDEHGMFSKIEGCPSESQIFYDYLYF